LSLWYRYLGPVTRQELVAALRRHNVKPKDAQVAVTRIMGFVDQDSQGRLRLLMPGMARAEQAIASARREN
jgi:hypothetical protein